MRRMIFAAAKGGTGKTTTAVNVAAGFALAGKRVALLDLDPYAGATVALGLSPDPEAFSIALARERLEGALRETSVPGLYVLPGGPAMADAGRRMGNAPKALRAALEGLRGFDLVLLDTPPAVGPLTVAALACGGELVLPVAASFADLATVAPFLHEAAAVTRDLAPDLRLRGLVPSRVVRTRLSFETLNTLRKNYPETTRTEIRQGAAIAEATAAGIPVLVYAPTSTGAEDFEALTRELSREK